MSSNTGFAFGGGASGNLLCYLTYIRRLNRRRIWYGQFLWVWGQLLWFWGFLRIGRHWQPSLCPNAGGKGQQLQVYAHLRYGCLQGQTYSFTAL